MRDTWYVLEDGTSADPRQVAFDDKGMLRDKSGKAVAIGAHGNPRSRGVDVDENGRLISAEKKVAEKQPDPKDRQVKATKENDAGYKTR